MSGFSPSWLTLREPADRAARNPEVLAACAKAFSNRDSVSVCDLGAGTGASVRAFAEILPIRQYWTLVDHDAGNLAAAAAILAEWADAATMDNDVLVLHHGPRRIDVRTRVHDLAADPRGWPQDTDLVTASAFVDLTSPPWIEKWVACLAADNVALLATLTANGTIAPEPPHPLDPHVVAAFHTHQARDKGFGPSAGPAAAGFLEHALHKAGYDIAAGESPWRLDGTQSALIQTTLNDVATAVAETHRIAAADLETWRTTATKAARLAVGHRDVFARRA